jgi:hypothetical protein
MRTPRELSRSLVVLAAALAANSVLGPLVTDTIRYRYGRAMINAAAVLVGRGHRAGPVLAFAPATFAIYMMPQYVIGPDYIGLPGNNERAIPFHIATMVLAMAIAIMAWRAIGDTVLPPDAPRSDRLRSWVLLGLAVFIAIGRWLPGMLDALGDSPSSTYRDDPTAFWLVGVLDLGLVVPAAVAAAVELRRGVRWSRKASYAIIAWFSLVPASIASMAITMQLDGDPLASTGNTVAMTGAGVVFTAAAVALFRPLFATDQRRVPVSRRAVDTPDVGRSHEPMSAVPTRGGDHAY